VRVWLDITGIRRGSDAAFMALSLGTALARRVDLRFCRRRPELVPLTPSRAGRELAAVPHGGRKTRLIALLRARAARLPRPVRIALGNTLRLQSRAHAAWRALLSLPRASVSRGPVPDRARAAPGDLLLVLAPSGDLGRLQAKGLRLVLALAETQPVLRPDRVTPQEAEEASLWQDHSLKIAEHVVAFCPQAMSWLQDQSGITPQFIVAASPVPAEPARRDIVLALGEIGVTGATPTVLQAWRHLLDKLPPQIDPARHLPRLVLAGPIGPLATTVLMQMTNSGNFGGTVQLIADPSTQDRARLLARAQFCIAIAPHEAWLRSAGESLAAGVACLSAQTVSGAVTVDPDNATALALQISAWLNTPPPAPSNAARSWDEVAADLLQGLAP